MLNLIKLLWSQFTNILSKLECLFHSRGQAGRNESRQTGRHVYRQAGRRADTFTGRKADRQQAGKRQGADLWVDLGFKNDIGRDT